jgi:Flp pilus assembly protein TadG
MRQRSQGLVRRGTTVVESAVAYLATFLLILGLIVGGVGIFRYQEVAALAREAARYACVRGSDYSEETGNTAATGKSVYDSVISARAVGLDKTKLSYAVSWKNSNRVATPIADNGRAVGNTVSVTVSYQWLPEFWLVGPINLSSTSTMQICY